MLKVAILGTSNSILRYGYISGLIAAIPDINLTSFAIGASPGLQFGTTLGQDFSRFDYVFYDSIPNDEEFEIYESSLPNYSADSLAIKDKVIFQILSTVASQTKLIMMGFCNKRFLNSYSDTFLSRQNLARRIGCQFVNIPSILTLFQELGMYEDLYEEHPAHPLQEISQKIGYFIGLEILSGAYKNKSLNCQNFSNNFSTWGDAIEKSHFLTSSYTNHLRSDTYARLSPNMEILFPSPKKIIGMYINAHDSNSYISFKLRGEVKSCGEFFFQKGIGTNQKIFCYVPNFPEIDQICFSRSESLSIFKPRMAGDLLETDNYVEISEILFWCDSDGDSYAFEPPLNSEADTFVMSRNILKHFNYLYRFNSD